MKKHCSITMMFLLFIVLARPVAAGDGWSLSSLNPFKKASTQQRARASVSDESVKKSVFPRMSMPSWNTKSPAPKRRTEPSTFAKIGQGTKDSRWQDQRRADTVEQELEKEEQFEPGTKFIEKLVLHLLVAAQERTQEG